MKFKWINIFVLLALVLSLFLSDKPAKAQSNTNAPGEFVPGEVVVGFKSGMNLSQSAVAASSAANTVHAMVVKVGDGGVALLRADASVDPQNLVDALKSLPDVVYAEPNYIYRLPPTESGPQEKAYLQQTYVLERLPKNSPTGKDFQAVPISYLQAMKSVNNGIAQATYPNDPYLWWNGGWEMVGADVVSSNATASAGVCVLDTGVDYLHPDLAGRIIKGYDFVNADADPMDDFGHGTHVAGIITAVANNKIGLAGASNAKVVAVKVLGSQGWGTNYDIAAGINFCANRADVKILSMSLGGDTGSLSIYNAIDYAVNTKNKIIVAAAGNDNADQHSYPAYYASYDEFSDKVLAVAASGQWVDNGDGTYYTDYWCKANYSNYGAWVSVIAPGSDIYSTTPWDKPFYMNYFYGYATRYDYMSGTSMATPFVAAAAARRWGYKPLETNEQVGSDVVNTGDQAQDSGDESCWPASMVGKHFIDIPTLLNRFAFQAQVIDASTGLPLNGAAVQAYQGTLLKGSALIVPYTYKDCCFTTDPTRIFTDFTRFTTVINLPRTGSLEDLGDGNTYAAYTLKVSKTGYTASPQSVFRHDQDRFWYSVNTIFMWDSAAIPPYSTNFEVTMGFTDGLNYDDSVPFDLDLDVWLPADPNPLDASQPAPFIVGLQGDDFGFREGEPLGAMTGFPFARYKREGGYTDGMPWENITIRSRLVHAPLVANPALPYYPGEYAIGVTDFGSTFDYYGTPVPVMGAYAVPYVYIWKNGVIKLFNMMDFQEPGDACNAHWWKAATITSGKTGVPTFTPNNDCGDGDIMPY